MRIASVLLTILSLVVAVVARADIAAIPQWVRPASTHNWDELAPSERTRPIIVGDIVYTANFAGDVYAVHRTQSYVLWHVHLPAGVDGSLAYGRSLLIVGDVKGDLVALNARDGSEAWRFKAEAEFLAPVAITRGKIFAMTSSDDLYALSETDGKEVWHFSRRGDEKMTVRGTASPVVFGEDVYQGFSDGYLVALNSMQGKELWKKKLATRSRFYDVDFTPSVDDQSVFVATFDGSLYSLDRLTGNTNWMFPVGAYGAGLMESDRLFVAGLNHVFYALDKAHGQVLWKTEFDGDVGFAPTRAGDYLVVTTSADPVFLIDPKDGHIQWRGSLGTGTFAGAAGNEDGWFYCLSNYGNLFSFQLQNVNLTKQGPKTLHPPSALQHPFGDFSSNKASS